MAAASADNSVTFNWAHSVDGYTTGGDNTIGAKLSTKGDLYVASTFGSSTDLPYLYFDCSLMLNAAGDTVKGSPYTGNSNNGNLLLQRVGLEDGVVQWSAYTCAGDIDQSSTQFVATDDDGLLAVVKTRGWVEAAGIDTLIGYVDPTGTLNTIVDHTTTKSEYRYVVTKINSEGAIEWYRIIYGLLRTDLDYATYNTIYIYAADIDSDGNIYLAGNFRTDLYVPCADGSVKSFTANNVSGWSGDSQEVVGDLFVLKLTAEGYYSDMLLASGTAACAFIDNLVHYNGKLYFNGRVKGDGSTMTLGGKTVNASSSYQTVIMGAISASDLSVDYLTTLTSVANSSNSFVVQNKYAQYYDGKIYFTGLLNGGWRREGETTDLVNTNATVLKGYVLAMDTDDGTASAACLSDATGISGYYGIYYGNEYIYAHGYDMNGVGAILTVLDKSTLQLTGTQYTICSYGTVAVCGEPVQTGEYFVMLNRGGKANTTTNTATFYGSDTSFSNLNCWGSVYYCYSMADAPEDSGVTRALADQDGDDCDVYTITGIRVRSASSMTEATSGLAPGIYIIGHKKVAVR